jgi:hypothetical protein
MHKNVCGFCKFQWFTILADYFWGFSALRKMERGRTVRREKALLFPVTFLCGIKQKNFD